MIHKDDHELVREVLQGNLSSFGILVIRYQTRIYGMVLQMTADSDSAKDLTQEIFLKAYLNLARFDFRYRFFSWLYRISLNETINFLKYRKQYLGLDCVLTVPDKPDTEEAGLKAHKEFRKVLCNLRSDYRSLILLKYWFGLSYEEMAETLGISVKKVKNRLYYARLTFRDKLHASNYFEND